VYSRQLMLRVRSLHRGAISHATHKMFSQERPGRKAQKIRTEDRGQTSCGDRSMCGCVCFCCNRTQRECESLRVFFLQSTSRKEVFTKETTLLLLNVDSLKLMGPFSAISDAVEGLVPGAFGGRGNLQVKVAPAEASIFVATVESGISGGPKTSIEIEALVAFLREAGEVKAEVQEAWNRPGPEESLRSCETVGEEKVTGGRPKAEVQEAWSRPAPKESPSACEPVGEEKPTGPRTENAYVDKSWLLRVWRLQKGVVNPATDKIFSMVRPPRPPTKPQISHATRVKEWKRRKWEGLLRGDPSAPPLPATLSPGLCATDAALAASSQGAGREIAVSREQDASRKKRDRGQSRAGPEHSQC